ncbi:unnamed protein product [Thelazia callipaeda]|uniref:Protein kinase domain-containing protein n=1 Tax=Thelazia callipaeda TaxID=103827 RepID=A0A0N5CWA6_THECL|nr:unnamed protein product [Thelazia callipaeda]
MMTCMDEKGFFTNFCDSNEAEYHQIQNDGFCIEEKKLATVGKRAKKTPSWSDFHFPPPPSDMCGVNESTMKPLLIPQIVTSSNISNNRPPLRDYQTCHRSHVNNPVQYRIDNDDNLHYATSSVRISNSKHRRRLNRVNNDQVVLGSELGRGRSVLEDEAKILSKTDHENIIKLYGVGDDLTIYLELALYGDVRQYLAHNSDVSYLNMLKLAVEVASGMKYLEQKGVVHGHLSPQCILISHNAEVKIGSPRGHLHHAQLRYSAPESIIANEWSNKSDVWSFAVTTWEIFNYCTVIPFAELTNAQLLENARHIYDGYEGIYLNLPVSIPQQVKSLLSDCWQRKATDRPTFLEIHCILSMRNSGLPIICQNGNGTILRSVAI